MSRPHSEDVYKFGAVAPPVGMVEVAPALPANLPKCEWVMVTPMMANTWLDQNNHRNRNLRRGYVERLARDMREGRWRGENGEPIRFDVCCRMADGQHRCKACVVANMSFLCLIVRDIPEDCYHTIGIGAGKSVADHISPYGVKNASLVQAATRLIVMWKNGHLSSTSGAKFPTVPEVIAELDDNPEIHDSVRFVAGLSGLKNVLPTSIGALIHYVAFLNSSIEQEQAERFLVKIANGLELTLSDPVTPLRKYLLDMKRGSSKVKANGGYTLHMTIKAWNYTKAGKAAQRLFISEKEPFPELV